MTGDQERWAEAAMVLRLHGERAHLYVAERVSALAVAGDLEGVERWCEIGDRVLRLLQPGTPH